MQHRILSGFLKRNVDANLDDLEEKKYTKIFLFSRHYPQLQEFVCFVVNITKE